MPNPTTLLELIQVAPAERTGVILPESGIRVSYQQLRDQVTEMADALASLGIDEGRPRRHLPAQRTARPIVSFLAASIAGTAAPLNPGYREEEVSFYLEDTGAKVLLCPPDGAAEARQAAKARGVPVYSLEMDATGFVRIAGAPGGKTADAAVAGRCRPGPAHQRKHRASQTRADPASQYHRFDAEHRGALRLSPDDVSLCVMPLFHVHGLVASTLSTLLSGGTVVVPAKFNALSFWRTVRDTNATWYSAVPTIHNLLLSRAGERAARGRGRPALHPLVQRVAAGGDDGADGARLRRAGARSLRDDRSVAPDGVQSAAAGGAEAGLGRTGNRRPDRHHGRGRQPSRQPASAAKS